MSQTKSKSPTRYRIQILLLTVWVILLGGGFWRLFVYSNTPSDAAQAKKTWPAETLLSRDPDTSTLVIFAHPHCPCSDASIGELERLLPHIQDKVKTFVVFYKPQKKSVDWAKGAPLWKKAISIPGVLVSLDENGVEAMNFGSKTSGQTFLYDPEGNLVFRGGITPQRGHMGDSEGRNSILNFISTGKITVSSAPVFGCSLKNPERAKGEASK